MKSLHWQIALAASSVNHLIPININNAINQRPLDYQLADLPGSLSLEKLVEFFTTNTIIVDTSAARDLVWDVAIHKGAELVFANKNALSTSWSEASALFNNPHIRYEATVGAGLPVINTLRTWSPAGIRSTELKV